MLLIHNSPYLVLEAVDTEGAELTSLYLLRGVQDNTGEHA